MAKKITNNPKPAVNKNNRGQPNLARVPEEKAFRCNDGQIFRDLESLAEGLERMSDETFAYHYNDNKNDFSIWVMEVVGDEELARGLKTSKSRQQALKQVKQRYYDLTRLEG